jgi:glucose/arabinose dehydrogenase
MFLMKKGSDFGWPYCYYDQKQKKKLVQPEYGGDKIRTDRCDGKGKPIYTFPGHWAPNGLVFYTGTQFPEKYRNGAFIAFHGSWNRAPRPQEGYFVVFLPFKNGMPMAITKFLLMDLQVKLKHHRVLTSDHAVWHKARMVHYLFAMIRKEEFGK